MRTLPAILENAKNREVLSYLASRCRHGNDLQPLRELLSHYDGVDWFCPDAEKSLYCLWYTGNTVFAYGEGEHSVGLRLPEAGASQAQHHARARRLFDGETWYDLPCDCARLASLTRLAYDYART